jgi:ABC-type polysaccharide/polyol phosphate export permease
MRDLVQVLGMVLSVLFYLTPIVYSTEMAPAAVRSWLGANPLFWLIDLYRAALLGTELSVASTVLFGVIAVGGCWASLRWFRRVSTDLTDDL